jgi:hypothetical protein
MRRALTALAATVALAGCTTTGTTSAARTPTPSATPAPAGPGSPAASPSPAASGVRPPAAASPIGCRYDVSTGDRPSWAQVGFSEPGGSPFVTSAHGDMIGVLFGYPLMEPRPADGSNNKILWIPREPSADNLHITARRDGSTDTTSFDLGPPGPSLTNMPRAGCWHLTLTWGPHTDTIDLLYDRP